MTDRTDRPCQRNPVAIPRSISTPTRPLRKRSRQDEAARLDTGHRVRSAPIGGVEQAIERIHGFREM